MMANLKAPLPDELAWLEGDVQALVRPTAFIKSPHGKRSVGQSIAPLGSTRAWGSPDIPPDVAAHLPTGCPRVGVVWVFINLYGDWAGTARFDPRDATAIVWHPRPSRPQEPMAAQWSLDVSLPCSTPQTLPSIASNWDSMAERYDDWVQDHYRTASDIQIGGWVWPIQGDFDDRQETFVCAMERQSFGDSGAVYLHFSLEEGFFVHVETC